MKPTGFITEVVLIVLLVLSLSWLLDERPASFKEVESVVKLAEGHPLAKEKVRSFLSRNPEPSRAALREIEEEINRIRVIDQSKKVTGINNFGPLFEQKAKEEEEAAESLFTLLWKVMIVTSPFGVFFLLQTHKRIRDGR